MRRLLVEEDDAALTMDFRLDPEGGKTGGLGGLGCMQACKQGCRQAGQACCP